MKMVFAFVAGVLVAAGAGAAAQCIQEGEMVPKVRIVDFRTKETLLRCRVMVPLAGGNLILCDR